MQLRWLAVGLMLAAMADGARAAIPDSAVVVSCNDYTHLVQLRKLTFAIVDGVDALTKQSLQAPQLRTLTLLGAIGPVTRMRTDVGTHPALFVDMQQPGRTVALLGTDAGAALQPFYYAVELGSAGTQKCSPGPAFPAVQQAVTGLPELAELAYFEYSDKHAALSCRPADRPGAPVSHLVRALSFQPASSNLQVLDVTLDPVSSRIHLDEFEERQSDVRYYPAEMLPTPRSPGPKSAEFLLTKTPSIDGLGQARYSARFFDGERTQRLACEPRWGFVNNIEKPLALARSLVRPKSLPLPAGTLAQAERSLCEDVESLKILQVRYSDLLFKVPGVNSHGISLYRAQESPLNEQCFCLIIGVRSEAQLAQAQAMIGETLEGHLVRYDDVYSDIVVGTGR